jgi:hypothetical protein
LQSYQQPVPRENSCGSKVISPGNLFSGSTDFPRKTAKHPEADNRLNGAFSEGKQGIWCFALEEKSTLHINFGTDAHQE